MVQLAAGDLMTEITLRHLGVPRVEYVGEDMCCLCRLSHLHHAAPARTAGRARTG
jgi:hypothetical protein